ncbi:MAG: UvrD-helicase domain-containing protein, partial [Acidimicrobiia bacterium]
SVLGRCAHPLNTRAGALRRSEARDVAAAVTTAVREGWTVFDEGTGAWRPARLGDVTILVPARTSLPFLEDELEQAGIPYRAESSSLVYATRAVRDLLMVLRAIADPTDHLRVVSALRTPLFACGDDDLFRFKVLRNGRWSYLGDQPATVPVDDPVARGLAYLREVHAQRYWLAPSELLDRIARDRFAFELGFAEGRPRDVWRRLRFVIDQARAWSDATGGTLREYLHWVTQQTAEGARVAEAVLPETDDDAVRIMTIHAAKGLEFPITIVSGMSTAPRGRYASAEVTFPATGGPPGYKLGRQVSTPEYDAWQPIDEQMGYEERIRLLYVACTRARDHLVVSLHRAERRNPPIPRNRTNAELLVAAMAEVEILESLPDAVPEDAEISVAPVAAVPTLAPPPLADWRAERSRALAGMSRPTTLAATALTEEGSLDVDDLDAPAHGLQKRPRDLDLPPWLRGRYGSAIGRAVHGVLQVVDLATAEGLDPAVAAQCEAEAVVGRERDVKRLAEAALGSASVREAAVSQHWREIYAAAPVGGDGRIVEGYIDLLYRSPSGGLVVVDYKTSATAAPEDLDRRVAGYRMQGAAYALVVAATTAERVERVTFIFLTPEGAIERHLDDLDSAVDAVLAAVKRGDVLEVDEI